MNSTEEQKIIKACLKEIEQKLNWGNSSQWHNDVFIELSELIQSKTKVLLSPTTLKRVWGRVNYNSSPSISTLNALAQFVDYENWRDFKIQANTTSPSWFRQKVIPYAGIIVPSAAILTLVFISFFSMMNISGNDSISDFSRIQFTSKPVTEGLPNSVIFDLDLEGIQSDSIHIQQFWDPTKTIILEKNQKQATGIYYFPGYFRSKLLVDGKVIREHDLFIKSIGWSGTLDYDPIPKYYKQEDIFGDGKLSFPESTIEEIKNSKTPLLSTFHLVDEFEGVSGDHIHISARLKNSFNEKWAVCESTRIVVLGKRGALIVPFSQLGCVSDIGLMMNDVYLSGKKNDLSAFGVGLSDYRDISIDIVNKNISISVDGKEIYTNSYTKSIGEFVGMRFRFLGLGEVDKLKVTDITKDKTVIHQGK